VPKGFDKAMTDVREPGANSKVASVRFVFQNLFKLLSYGKFGLFRLDLARKELAKG